VREKAGHKVLVILNLSDKAQPIAVQDKSLLGSPFNVFGGSPEKLTSKPWQVEPWGYAVYEYGK